MSTLGRQLVTTRGVCLLGIPEELQARILQDLSGADLLTCVKVCKLWKAVVHTSSALHYPVRLMWAGMRDGPPSGSAIIERSQALKAYQAIWGTNGLPHRTLEAPPGFRFLQDSGDIFVYTAKGTNGAWSFKFYRPSSPFSGVTEQSWTIKHWKLSNHDYFDDENDESNFRGDVHSVAVDVGQDLLGLTKLVPDEWPMIFVLSLSENGAPHPLAQHPRLHGGCSHDTVTQDLLEEIAIVGDLIEWTIFGANTSMHVYNWKTGNIIWEDIECEAEGFEQYYDTRCRILDSEHILKVVGTDIHVYPTWKMVRGEWDSIPPRCLLQLPPLAKEWTSHSFSCHIRRPPTHSGCNPHFEGDPDLTLMVVRYIVDDRHGDEDCSVVAFIPLSTILKVARHVDHRGPKSRKPTSASWSGPKCVPWDEWVTHGARLVVIPSAGRYSAPQVLTMGSRVALAFPPKPVTSTAGKVQAARDVYFFDMHPLAFETLVEGPDWTPPWLLDCYAEDQTRIFRGAVNSTLPYRVGKTEAITEAGGDNEICLSYDGLLSF